jgi:hypothetical protein
MSLDERNVLVARPIMAATRTYLRPGRRTATCRRATAATTTRRCPDPPGWEDTMALDPRDSRVSR